MTPRIPDPTPIGAGAPTAGGAAVPPHASASATLPRFVLDAFAAAYARFPYTPAEVETLWADEAVHRANNLSQLAASPDTTFVEHSHGRP